MLNQSVNPSISAATQLSVFVKRQVSVPPNPFSFSKHRDGIGLELNKFFAHGFAIITSNNYKNPYSAAQPYARTIPAFRVLFTADYVAEITPLSKPKLLEIIETMIPKAARKWLADIGRRGGSVKSKAKSAAARKNGRKGGRPRKKKA
jgi:hypothetical protein